MSINWGLVVGVFVGNFFLYLWLSKPWWHGAAVGSIAAFLLILFYWIRG